MICFEYNAKKNQISKRLFDNYCRGKGMPCLKKEVKRTGSGYRIQG
jgi:hypothetical protein